MAAELPIIQIGMMTNRGRFKPIFLIIANKLDKWTFSCAFKTVQEQAGSAPSYLLADACAATRAAFRQVFGADSEVSVKMGMCWYHVSKNVKRKLGKANITS